MDTRLTFRAESSIGTVLGAIAGQFKKHEHTELLTRYGIAILAGFLSVGMPDGFPRSCRS